MGTGMVKGGWREAKKGIGMLRRERAAGRGKGQTADPPRVRRLSGPGESCAALSTSPSSHPLTFHSPSPRIDKRHRVAVSLAFRGL